MGKIRFFYIHFGTRFFFFLCILIDNEKKPQKIRASSFYRLPFVFCFLYFFFIGTGRLAVVTFPFNSAWNVTWWNIRKFRENCRRKRERERPPGAIENKIKNCVKKDRREQQLFYFILQGNGKTWFGQQQRYLLEMHFESSSNDATRANAFHLFAACCAVWLCVHS